MNYKHVCHVIAFIFFSCLHAVKESPIVIVTASYRNAHLLDEYFDSILKQSYKNTKIIYVADNDFATDSDHTGALANDYVLKNNLGNQVKIIRNRNRQLALGNLYKAILSCDDEAIIAIVDGDDGLEKDALSKVNTMYLNPEREIWGTYGNFKWKSSNQPCTWTKPIPEDILKNNALRKWGNGPTHLRTFKAWVCKQVKIKDLFFEGAFFKSAYDIALFEPIFEMIGERYDITQEVLYNYNDMNVINDHKVDRNLQLTLDHFVRSKPPYPRLNASLSGRIEALKNQDVFKADVIFCSNSNDINLEQLAIKSKKLKNIRNFYVFADNVTPTNTCIDGECTTQNIMIQSYSRLTQTIQESPSNYLLFMGDNTHDELLDITQAIMWLEKTHAHAFYCGLSKIIFDSRLDMQNLPAVQISLEDQNADTTFAWQYQAKSKPDLTTLMALVRKSDIVRALKLDEATSAKVLDSLWNGSLDKEDVGLFYLDPRNIATQ